MVSGLGRLYGCFQFLINCHLLRCHFFKVAAILSDILGRKITHVNLPEEQFTAGHRCSRCSRRVRRDPGGHGHGNRPQRGEQAE